MSVFIYMSVEHWTYQFGTSLDAFSVLHETVKGQNWRSTSIQILQVPSHQILYIIRSPTYASLPNISFCLVCLSQWYVVSSTNIKCIHSLNALKAKSSLHTLDSSYIGLRMITKYPMLHRYNITRLDNAS